MLTTGSSVLDSVITLAPGKITFVSGERGSGKTLLALSACARASGFVYFDGDGSVEDTLPHGLFARADDLDAVTRGVRKVAPHTELVVVDGASGMRVAGYGPVWKRAAHAWRRTLCDLGPAVARSGAALLVLSRTDMFAVKARSSSWARLTSSFKTQGLEKTGLWIEAERQDRVKTLYVFGHGFVE